MRDMEWERRFQVVPLARAGVCEPVNRLHHWRGVPFFVSTWLVPDPI
jgi:hypothetical protein